MDKYGVEYPIQNKKIKDKIKNTNKINYWEIFKKQLLQKNIKILSTKDDYINTDNFTFKCLSCNTQFKSSGTSIQHITCKCRKAISKYESDIYNWLKSLNINIIQSDRTLIAPLELDIYLPNHNIAIEFNRSILT